MGSRKNISLKSYNTDIRSVISQDNCKCTFICLFLLDFRRNSCLLEKQPQKMKNDGSRGNDVCVIAIK